MTKTKKLRPSKPGLDMNGDKRERPATVVWKGLLCFHATAAGLLFLWAWWPETFVAAAVAGAAGIVLLAWWSAGN